MRKKTKIIIEIVISIMIIFIFGISIILYKNNGNTNNPIDCNQNYSWHTDPNRLKLPEMAENLTLRVDFKNGTILEFTNVSLENHYTSVFDLLNKCCDIKYQIYCWNPVAIYVTYINNVGVGWTYKLNGVIVNLAANYVAVQNNSIVLWEFVGV
ncbi:MAG: DUF4430 domain-containing protein [Promethearchaeota archaeon]